MSGTNDCSRRLEDLAPSRAMWDPLRETVRVILLGITSMALGVQASTGPAPSPLDISVIQGLASPGRVAADADAQAAKVAAERPTLPAASVPPKLTSPVLADPAPAATVQAMPPSATTSVHAVEKTSVAAPRKPIPPARVLTYPGQPAPMRSEVIRDLTVKNVPPSPPKTSPEVEHPQILPKPAKPTPAAASPATPKGPVPPRSAPPQPTHAAVSGPAVVAPAVTASPASLSLSVQPAPLNAKVILGLTRPGNAASGRSLSTMALEPRPLPPSQMAVIRDVFAPEQAR